MSYLCESKNFSLSLSVNILFSAPEIFKPAWQIKVKSHETKNEKSVINSWELQ